jgi:hypothetical protein
VCGASPSNYTEITALGASLGRSATDLLALARANDPFYCGSPTDLQRAEWFAEQWERFQFRHGVHLRRIHYVLMSQKKAILLPNGMPYQNTMVVWDALSTASKAARYLGLVAIDAFDDRRNPPAVIYETDAQGAVLVRASEPYFSVFVPSDDQLHPKLHVECVAHRPRYHLEVWCEKSTMNDVLLPICSAHSANLITGLGELSITACDLFVRRLDHTRRPGRIFYVSDFDPGGLSMPVAVARKIEFLAKNLDLDIRLYPIVLTPAQIHEFALPRVPIKESERRRERFESRNGIGATELDALEALHPGHLGRIVTEHIERYRDPDIGAAEDRLAQRIQESAERAEVKVLKKYTNQLDAACAELEGIRLQAGDWSARHFPLGHAISEAMTAAARRVGKAFEPPEEAEAQELDNPLLDTTRSYLDQLDAYRRFQKRDT